MRPKSVESMLTFGAPNTGWFRMFVESRRNSNSLPSVSRTRLIRLASSVNRAGTFNHVSTKVADLPGDRIYQNGLSLGVENGEVCVARVERVRGRYRVYSRVCALE